MDFTKLYLSADGRVSRQQWWLYYVIPYWLGLFILAFVDDAIGMSDAESSFGLLISLWVLIMIVPGIMMSIKRFHDRDKTGWWVLIGLVPVIGALWFLIELGMLKGTEGPNRFGPPVVD